MPFFDGVRRFIKSAYSRFFPRRNCCNINQLINKKVKLVIIEHVEDDSDKPKDECEGEDVDEMHPLIHNKPCYPCDETSATQSGCKPGLESASIASSSSKLTGEIVKLNQKVLIRTNFNHNKQSVKAIKRGSLELICPCASKKTKKVNRNSDQEPISKVLRRKIVCIVCGQSLRFTPYRIRNNLCRKCKVIIYNERVTCDSSKNAAI